MGILSKVAGGVFSGVRVFKNEKTKLADQAAGQMREVGRLGQQLVIMQLGH